VRLSELAPLVSQYRAGLEAEMVLLRRLDVLSSQQREVAQSGDVDRLNAITEERNRLMTTLVTIEHDLKPVRQELLRARPQLDGIVEFREVVQMHREAAEMVSAIMNFDRVSLDALKEAEIARRTAAQSLEQGESTLAAYRRVVNPALEPATLVNRRG
jgi:hypothetical protein